jgi:hypothetical protein
MRDQQFPELLALLLEIKNLRIDNVKVSLGRMQNFMNSACIEHLDFRYVSDKSFGVLETRVFALKFMYSEKATIFDEISKFNLKLLSSVKKSLEISSYFCGPLRIYEHYFSYI